MTKYTTIERITQAACAFVCAAAVGTGTMLQTATHADAIDLQEPPQIVGAMPIQATEDKVIAVFTAEPLKRARGVLPDAPESNTSQEEKSADIADNPVEAEPETLDNQEPVPETPTMTSVGYWDVTAYTWTGNRCANGEYPYEGLCAVNGLPFGTQIYIEGVGYLTVADRGGMKGKYDVDIYMDSESACWQWGRQKLEIWIVEG